MQRCKPCVITIGTKECEVAFHVSSSSGLPPIIGGRDLERNGLDLLYSTIEVKLGGDHDSVPMILAAPEDPDDEPNGAPDAELRESLREIAERQELMKMGKANVSPVIIPVTGTPPRRMPTRPIPDPMKIKVTEWAEKLMGEGSLERAPQATHFSPLLLVREDGHKDRMVIDYRGSEPHIGLARILPPKNGRPALLHPKVQLLFVVTRLP